MGGLLFCNFFNFLYWRFGWRTVCLLPVLTTMNMALFLKRAFVFIIPFLAIIAIEGIIDPFNYFSAEKNKKLIEAKRDISLKKNAYLYTLIEYDREPASTVILGDSRAGRLSPAFFDGLTNEKVANLAGGGGSLEDVIKIFWDISNQKKLKKIYIGISIETYSGTLLKDRVTQIGRAHV